MKPALFVLTVTLLVRSVAATSLEEWVESSEQPEAVQEWLDELRADPVDLNSASLVELSRLPFFDRMSVGELMEQRRNRGGFRTLSEVLSLPLLTTEQREVLAAFTTVIPRQPGKARVSCTVQSASDVRSVTRGDFTSGQTTSGFVYARTQGRQLEALEDARAGVEYRNSRCRLLAGDYQFESGCGLVFGSSYGGGGWLSRPGSVIPNSARGLKSKPTSDALAGLRGFGIHFGMGWVDASLLVSENRLDAESNDHGIERISTVDASSDELQAARDAQLSERLIGAEVGTGGRVWHAAISGYRSQFSPALDPDRSLEQPYVLRGSQVQVGGFNLRATLMGIEATLDAAKSNPGGFAQQAAIAATGEQLAVAVYNVFAEPDYYSLHGKSWSGFEGETGNVQRTGMRLRLRHSRLEHLVDAWSSITPFRTATSPLRKESGGVSCKSNVMITPSIAIKVLASKGWNEETSSSEPARMVSLERGQIEATLQHTLEWRTRFEIRANRDKGTQSTALFVQARRRFAATVMTLRVTVFDVESSDVAVRFYEDTPRGMYPLIALYDSGSRIAVMGSGQLGSIALAVKVAHMTLLSSSGSKGSFDGTLQMSLDW